MNIIKGTKGNDTLTGTDEPDRIYGYAGNDILDGGAGNDKLYGASGNDTYLFGIGSGEDYVFEYDATPGNLDTIQLGNSIATTDVIISRGISDLSININGTTDQLTLDYWFASDAEKIEQVRFADGTLWDVEDLLANLVDYATNGNNYLVGDSGANSLSGLKGNDIYIVDHAGDEVTEKQNEGADTVEAKITYKLAANVENLTLIGNAAINGRGNALNNSIYGNSNNNILDGGVGDDYLNGGLGNDTYLFGIGSGHDRVDEYYDTPGILDTIQLGNGIAPTDVIIRRDINNLTIKINGTTDQITLSGWFDNYDYLIEQVKFADGTLWNVAVLLAKSRVATDGNDYLVGDRGANTLKGGAGNDVLIGEEGNDVLNGGVGDDDLDGGSGNDTYLFGIGSGQDTVSDYNYNINPVNLDTIQLGNGIAPTDVTIVRGIRNLTIKINGTTDQLTLSDWFTSDADKIEQVKFADGTLWDVADLLANLTDLATDGDDYLAGDSGANKLSGLKGNDIYKIDHAGDEVKERLNEGDDTVEAEITYKLAANIENLTLTGSVAINGTGNALNNSIYGNIADNILSGGLGEDVLKGDSGNDILNGGAGDDRLYSSGYVYYGDVEIRDDSGNDILNGGAGDDELVAGFGNDILNGGAGDDLLNSEYYWPPNWDKGGKGINKLNGSLAIDVLNGGAGNDRLTDGTGDDILNGGPGDDVLNQGTGNDILNGGAGNDDLGFTVFGWSYYLGTGDDILNGGVGNDSLYGGDDNDILKGGVGNDYLNGGFGNDILKGGAGDDNLEGGTGDDIFQLTPYSTDTIRDFSIVNDTIQLAYNEFTRLTTSGPLNAANFIKGAAAADTNDYVIYNKGTGELWFDADGSDPGAAEQIALLGTGTTHPALTFADFIVI